MFEKQVSYSKIVALIRKQINEVRTNPISLSGYLNSKKVRFDTGDPLVFYPLKKAKQLCVRTKQGFKAVEQLDKYLLKQSACQTLKWSYQLHLIAHKKAARLAKSETSLSTKDAIQQILQMVQQEKGMSVREYESHIQLNNSHDIYNKEAIQNMKGSLRQGVECILDDEYYLVYYGVIDPKQLLSKLLIDDGFPKREHRKAILNKRMNHIGIGIHQHPTQCFIVVIILANHVKQITKQTQSDQASCQCQVI